MESKLPSYLLQRPVFTPPPGKRARLTFLDKTILNTAKAVKSVYLQAESADESNFARRISPHVKLFSLIWFVVVISIANNIHAQLFASLFIFALFLASRLRIAEIYRKIFLLAFVFGFVVILPASLNVITPGKIIFNLFHLNKPLHFWIYNIPADIGLTDNGTRVVSLIFLRVLNSVSFSLLIVFTTPFQPFIKTFRLIGIPDTFLMIISLAYKYIFILSRTIEEAYFALKSRLSGNIGSNRMRNLAGGRIFYIYKRSQLIYEGTYLAMISRGYQGKVKLTVPFNFTARDLFVLIVMVAAGLFIILI